MHTEQNVSIRVVAPLKKITKERPCIVENINVSVHQELASH